MTIYNLADDIIEENHNMLKRFNEHRHEERVIPFEYSKKISLNNLVYKLKENPEPYHTAIIGIIEKASGILEDAFSLELANEIALYYSYKFSEIINVHPLVFDLAQKFLPTFECIKQYDNNLKNPVECIVYTITNLYGRILF
jgi:hypothetical protein